MPKKSTGTSVKVDFTGVEVNSFDVPDGPYVFNVAAVTQKKSQESGQFYLSWELKVDDGPYKGRKVWDNTSLQPQALWKLRGMLEAMGMDIEDGEFEIDLEEMQGQLVGGEVVNEKYQGKDKPRIAGYMSPDEVDAAETDEDDQQEEESEPPKKSSKSAATTKKKSEPEPEPEEPEEAEPEPEEEPEPPKVTRKKKTATADFEVGQAVTFDDEGETYKGKIHSVGDDTVEVKVGKDIWELEKSEVSAA
jgi:hypothetical protein